MIQIAKDFSLNGIFNISILENLPEVMHRYGSDFNNVPTDKLCWMTYAGKKGNISFSRNTHQFYPDLAVYVVDYMKSIIDVPLHPERVHFIRTIGEVDPHRDEANRGCCINLGLKNSNTAVTEISSDPDITNFDTTKESFVCQDGGVYLLDTQKIHSVKGTAEKRFLITYGFKASFDIILDRIKK